MNNCLLEKYRVLVLSRALFGSSCSLTLVWNCLPFTFLTICLIFLDERWTRPSLFCRKVFKFPLVSFSISSSTPFSTPPQNTTSFRLSVACFLFLASSLSNFSFSSPTLPALQSTVCLRNRGAPFSLSLSTCHIGQIVKYCSEFILLLQVNSFPVKDVKCVILSFFFQNSMINHIALLSCF